MSKLLDDWWEENSYWEGEIITPSIAQEIIRQGMLAAADIADDHASWKIGKIIREAAVSDG